MIHDSFTELKVSRQRKWQLRKVAEGRCHLCGQPKSQNMVTCDACSIKRRERVRKQQGAKRRYLNAKSYQNEIQTSNGH